MDDLMKGRLVILIDNKETRRNMAQHLEVGKRYPWSVVCVYSDGSRQPVQAPTVITSPSWQTSLQVDSQFVTAVAPGAEVLLTVYDTARGLTATAAVIVDAPPAPAPVGLEFTISATPA